MSEDTNTSNITASTTTGTTSTTTCSAPANIAEGENVPKKESLQKLKNELESELIPSVDEKLQDVVWMRKAYPPHIAQEIKLSYEARLYRLKNAPVSGQNRFEEANQLLEGVNLDSRIERIESMASDIVKLRLENEKKAQLTMEKVENLEAARAIFENENDLNDSGYSA